MTDLSKVKLPSAWPGPRAQIEKQLRELLGPIPHERVDVQVKTADEYDGPGYTRRRINYFVNDWERVSAWLFVPEGKEEVPAIVCCHQETEHGKDETAGLGGDTRFAFAQHYAELGYVAIAPECVTTGERKSARTEAFDTDQFYKDHAHWSLAGKMLSDHLYAVDVLSEFKRVDPARIGVIGHGLGGFNALMLAAFDDRIRACVASCGFTRFATDKQPDRWTGANGLNLLPGLQEFIDAGEFPFDWEHILAIAAPSPILVLTALNDTPYASPKSCDKAVKQAAKIYKLLGAANAIDHFPHNDGYTVSVENREMADEWFERWL